MYFNNLIPKKYIHKANESERQKTEHYILYEDLELLAILKDSLVIIPGYFVSKNFSKTPQGSPISYVLRVSPEKWKPIEKIVIEYFNEHFKTLNAENTSENDSSFQIKRVDFW